MLLALCMVLIMLPVTVLADEPPSVEITGKTVAQIKEDIETALKGEGVTGSVISSWAHKTCYLEAQRK